MNKNIKQILSVIISISLIGVQTLQAVPLEVDKSSNTPTLYTAPNGIPIVDITKPNTNGISHNKFNTFNVGKEGLILNNSNKPINTQLAGYIPHNASLGGTHAKLILNEVTGTSRSLLQGYTEVAGQAADIIIANPNGISVNGGGFINTPNVTLTTGMPLFSSGSFVGFEVTQGDIILENQGLNTNNVNQVNLYTKALTLNAKIYADKLHIISGKNKINPDGSYTPLESFESGIAVDSSLLGGLYANKIILESSGNGVGVHMPPEVFAQDELTINAKGDIVLQNTIAENALHVNTDTNLYNTDEMLANDIVFNAKNIFNTHTISAKNTLNITATNVDNQGIISSASNMTFDVENLDNYAMLFSGINMSLYVSDTLYNHENANILAMNNINIGKEEQKTKLVKNETANIETINGDINIYAEELTNTTNPLDKKEVFVKNEYFDSNNLPVSWAISELKKEGKTYKQSNMIKAFYCTSSSEGGCDRRQEVYAYAMNDDEYQETYYVEKNANTNGAVSTQLVVASTPYFSGKTIHRGEDEIPIYKYSIEYVIATDVLAKLNEYSSKFGVNTKSGNIWNIISNTNPEFRYVPAIGNEVRRIANITTKDEQIDTTPVPSTILSGGKMNLYINNTKNYLSQIASNDTLTITGDSFDNSGENLYRIHAFTGQYYYKYKDGGMFHSDKYTWAPLPSKTTYETIGQVYSSVYSAKDIDANILSVNNIDIKDNQAPLGASGSTVKLDESLDTIKIDPHTHQVQIQLPEDKYGLFIHSNNQEAKYLVETNPAFTNFNNFISSDYMLSKLGLDPDKSMKRLGDGLYENHLIRESIFTQSGKRYLNTNIKTDQEQFTYLMNNALSVKDDLQLSVGIALTKEQIAALNKDIVWMEEKLIDGENVLVPTVYLVDLSTIDSSLIIANDTISLNVENLTNTGSISADKDIKIIATKDIINAGGSLSAKEALHVKADGDIANVSAILKGGSIDIESNTFSSDVATNTLVKKLDNGYETNTLVSQKSQILSDTTVSIITKEDIALVGTDVKAKGDVTLSSQSGDVSIEAKEVSNTFDNKTVTGYLKQSNTEQLSSTIEAENLHVKAKDIDIKASSVEVKEDINLNASGDVNIQEASNQHSYELNHKVKGGFFGGSHTLKDTINKTQVISSILKANNVNISSKDTKLIASQIIANEAQISADILTLISKTNLDYEDHFEDKSGMMTRTIKSKGHLNESVVEAKIQTNKLIFNQEDITNQLKQLGIQENEIQTKITQELQTDNIVKILSSQHNLSHEQIELVKAMASSKEWDESHTSLTGLGSIVVAVVVTVFTAGLGTGEAIAGTAAAQSAVTAAELAVATSGTLASEAALVSATSALTTAQITAAAINAVVASTATQLATAAITGESFKLDVKALIQSAVTAGALSYISQFTNVTKYGFEKGALSTKVAQAGVNAGVKTAITGGSFKDNLISEAGSIAFNTIGHDLYNNSEYKDILPPKSVVQGLVGGALAKLQGGDFAAGAISTATSHVVSEYMLNSVIENFDPENPPFDINDKEAALKYTEQLKTQITAISSLVGTIATKAVKPDISDQDLINSNDIAQNAVENNAVFLAGSIIFALTLYANTPDVKEEPKTGLPNSALNPALDGAVFAYDVTKELIDGGVPTEAIIIALGHKLHISKSAAKKIVDDVKVGVKPKVEDSSKIWSSTKNNSSVENAFSHYKKHKNEFPEYSNAKQYVNGATKFITNPPNGTLTKTRHNGDTILYNPTTNTFAVKDSSGIPKTMFKPNPEKHGYENNMEYFNAQ